MSAFELTSGTAGKGGLSALWIGWILAPTWWLTQFEVRYAAVGWACAHGFNAFVPGFGIFAVLVGFIIWFAAYRSGRESDGLRAGGFLARGASWTALAFALLTAVQILPDLFIDLCRR